MKLFDTISKSAGVALLGASMLFMIVHVIGIFGTAAFLPGLFSGVAGLALMLKPDQPSALPSELDERLKRLEALVRATQQDLLLAQEDLREINEERKFHRELRAGSEQLTTRQ